MQACANHTSQPTMTGLQKLATNNNQQIQQASHVDFDGGESLTGDSDTDRLLLEIVSAIVQLLVQQVGGGGQQQDGGNNNQNGGQQNQDDNDSDKGSGSGSGTGLSSQFNERDKGLLLDAIDVTPPPGPGTTINSIDDTDVSGNLNGGDNIALQTNSNRQDHTITDSEVRDFINTRNPPGTPTLTLTEQQSSALESRYGLTEVKISDTSGNKSIGIGDILSGIQERGDSKLRVDIPVDQAMLNLLQR